MIKGNVLPTKDSVLVTDMEDGEQIVNGIILLDDNGKDNGIRPRWAKVYAVGEEIDDISVGEWVYVDHGRWTRTIKCETSNGVVMIQKIDPSGILAKSKLSPNELNASRALKI
ncbi:MAG: hypothetical protein WC284_12620 [Candidimonas sp.]